MRLKPVTPFLADGFVDASGPSELGLYEWDGRTIKAHRADIRKYFGFCSEL